MLTLYGWSKDLQRILKRKLKIINKLLTVSGTLPIPALVYFMLKKLYLNASKANMQEFENN